MGIVVKNLNTYILSINLIYNILVALKEKIAFINNIYQLYLFI